MRKVPFQREIEDLFASDKSAILKILGGAFVGGAVTARIVFKNQTGGLSNLSSTMKAVFIVTGGIVAAFVVVLLMLRDVVVRRVQQGKRVNPLLRAYFGQGNGCMMLALWFVTVILVTFVVTMLTANL
jgi:hypothetical protein